MVLRALLVSALCVSCVQRPPVARLAQPTAVALATVLETDASLEVAAAPDRFQSQVSATLAERNLVVRELPQADVAEQFKGTRDTARRVATLMPLAGDARLVVLVETRPRYFSHLRGRFKWTVDARITMADGADLRTVDVDFPAILDFDHERGPEAVDAVAPLIADEVGQLADRFLGGREGFSAPAPEPQAAAPAPPPSDVIYFVLVDRFHNGNPENDGDTNPMDPIAWHGGDIRGVIDRLDYLQDLGVRTVWLSPVSDGRDTSFQGHGAFHGYWVHELDRMEPRLGAMEELRALSDALHARGMRLFLDLVLNHVDYDALLTREHPDWFHDNGPIQDWSDPRQLTDFNVHGLPDLAQENPEVFDHLVAASRVWIDRVHPDGLRLDAVKHIPLSFWRRYSAAIHDYAGDDFVLLGEVFDGNPATLATIAREGGFDAVFDFPVHYAVRESVCGSASLEKLGATLFADRAYSDLELVTFLDNHDLPRIATACGERSDRTLLAVTTLLSVRGTPCLTYGTEVALPGADEAQGRSDMVFDPDSAPLPKLALEVNERVRRLLALRQSTPALVHGRNEILAARRELLVMLRTLEDTGVLVALHTGHGKADVVLPDDLAGIPIADALTGRRLRATDLCVGPTQGLLVAFSPETAAERAALRAYFDRPRATRHVVVNVTGAPAGPLTLVGLGAELGNWDVGAGLSLHPDTHTASVELPVGGLFEAKLVSGGITWEPRDNRYLFVPTGTGAHALHLVWGA